MNNRLADKNDVIWLLVFALIVTLGYVTLTGWAEDVQTNYEQSVDLGCITDTECEALSLE